MDKDLVYKIALTKVPGVGSILAKSVIGYCGGVKEVFKKSKNFLKKAPGVGEVIAESIKSFQDFSEIEKEVEFLSRNNIKPVFFLDQDYPFRLKNIPDCPIILYTRGNENLSPEKCIAIVGTRKITEYGKRFVDQLIEDLVPYNPTIVSGLAYGVDIRAHKQCIKHGLNTYGVVAHGMDRIYPDLHANIASEMVQNGGAVLTEYTSGTKPNRENFPMRNRIVAGMVDAVIVVESAAKGGSLITAELANQYNRDVLALPGDFGKKSSAGCNYLIKSHKANLLEGVDDLVRLLNWDVKMEKSNQTQMFVELTSEEEKVMELLKSNSDMGVDQLMTTTEYSSSLLAMVLLELEMKNFIISLPGKRYQSII
ncbi:MAG: DNA-processing protein DprA [Bacteroidia bacterium]